MAARTGSCSSICIQSLLFQPVVEEGILFLSFFFFSKERSQPWISDKPSRVLRSPSAAASKPHTCIYQQVSCIDLFSLMAQTSTVYFFFYYLKFDFTCQSVRCSQYVSQAGREHRLIAFNSPIIIGLVRLFLVTDLTFAIFAEFLCFSQGLLWGSVQQ